MTYLSNSPAYTTILNYTVSVIAYHHHNEHEAADIEHYAKKQALADVQHARAELPNGRNAITLDTLD